MICSATGSHRSLRPWWAVIALRWIFSGEDDVYSDFLLEASARLWCVLMSNRFQRLVCELPCCRSAQGCHGLAPAPCTYELYVQ